MRLDAEMNYRLSTSTKRALFAIAERTGTTAAAVVRGKVEVFVSHPKWARTARLSAGTVDFRPLRQIVQVHVLREYLLGGLLCRRACEVGG
jgi:hypothetical protein